MKLLKTLVAGSLLVGATLVANPAFAAPFDWHIYWMNLNNTVEQLNVLPKTATSTMAVVGAQSHQETGAPGWYYLNTDQFSLDTNTPSGADAESRRLSVTSIASSLVTGLSGLLDAKADKTALAATDANVSTLQSQVNGITGHTTTVATTTRSIVTGTGATGWNVSTTSPADVRYSSTIVTTASIAGNSLGTIVLETAPTNSATSTAWTETGRCTNGQALSLAVALQSVQTSACQLSAYVPAGYFVKVRSISTAGTPTFTFNSGQEVIH